MWKECLPSCTKLRPCFLWYAGLKEIEEEERNNQILKVITGIFTLVVSVGELCLGIPDVSGLIGFAETLKAAIDQYENIKAGGHTLLPGKMGLFELASVRPVAPASLV